MSQERPDWYKRAEHGPFAGMPFDGRLRREVERKIAGTSGQPLKRRTYGKTVGLAASALLALCVVLLFVRMQASPADDPSGGEAPTTGVNDIADGDGASRTDAVLVNPAGTVRAEGTAESGKLQVVARDEESRTTLGAPSCLGVETDRQYQGNYNVVYDDNGKQSVVADLGNRTFIQPKDGVVEMSKLSFPDADVFLLVPAYKDCHGLELYAFSVARDGSGAALLEFQTADGTKAVNSYYRPDDQPSVKDGLLVLPSSEGPGGETPGGPQDRTFKLDLSTKAFVQVQPNGAEAEGKPGSTFTFGGRDYKIAYSGKNQEYLVHAAELEQGIVWSPAPKMAGSDSAQELNVHPAEPFVLYLNATIPKGKSGFDDASAFTALAPDNSKKLFTLPLRDGDNYVYLSGLYGAGKYIVYSTYSRKPGMNQPYREQLWALDSTNPEEAKPILDYHSTGGYLFSLGIEKNEGDVVTVVSTPDGDGNYKREALVYNLKTGKSSVPDAYSELESGIRYEIGGHTLVAAAVH